MIIVIDNNGFCYWIVIIFVSELVLKKQTLIFSGTSPSMKIFHSEILAKTFKSSYFFGWFRLSRRNVMIFVMITRDIASDQNYNKLHVVAISLIIEEKAMLKKRKVPLLKFCNHVILNFRDKNRILTAATKPQITR